MHYINLIDDSGRFDFIHGDFLSIYADTSSFIKITDEDYQTYLAYSTSPYELKYVEGKITYTPQDTDHIALKKARQAWVWEDIKQKRHTNTRGGVYIKSVGKWFHNDDSSRTQYLALQVLPKLPDHLMWKTMNNEFVPMTKDLLNEIAMTMLTEEQADFANAEKHRLAMLESDNPLEYDYSDGWSAIYA